MADSPLNPPGGGGATATTFNIGRNYVASGECSGTAFIHRQSFFASYEFTTHPSLDGTWLPTQGSVVSGILMHVMPSYTDTLEQFSTSSSDASGCANAANARQEHVISVSGNASTGMGSEGFIITSATGFTRRWTTAGDIPDQKTYTFMKVFLPLNGPIFTSAQTDNTLRDEVVRQIIRYVANGGLLYGAGKSSTPAIPKFDVNLVYI